MVASWMVDGEALVMMAVMISSNSPSWKGARTKTSDPDLRFQDGGGGAELFLEISVYLRGFQVIRSKLPEWEVRGPHGVATPPPGAAKGGPAPGPGVGPPWAFCSSPSGSVSIPLEKHLL